MHGSGARDHPPVPTPRRFEPPPRTQCDLCGIQEITAWWHHGGTATGPAMIAPGLASATPDSRWWAACAACSALVEHKQLARLMRRWRSNALVPAGQNRRAVLDNAAPGIVALIRDLLDSNPSGPYSSRNG